MHDLIYGVIDCALRYLEGNFQCCGELFSVYGSICSGNRKFSFDDFLSGTVGDYLLQNV